MPSATIVSPTVLQTSRAVPSPPAKRISSTPAAASAATAAQVSAAVDCVPSIAAPTTSVGSRPARSMLVSPMSPPAQTIGRSSGSCRSASAARSCAWGIAPNARACSTSPSVPFSPTLPPRPATGLTTRPIMRRSDGRRGDRPPSRSSARRARAWRWLDCRRRRWGPRSVGGAHG